MCNLIINELTSLGNIFFYRTYHFLSNKLSKIWLSLYTCILYIDVDSSALNLKLAAKMANLALQVGEGAE